MTKIVTRLRPPSDTKPPASHGNANEPPKSRMIFGPASGSATNLMTWHDLCKHPSAMANRSTRTSRAAAQRGFTLVELLVVVAMIGVLAALALVGYRKYMRSASSSEASAMIQGIRAAEEAYKAEMLVYNDVSTSLSTPSAYYPLDPSACSPGQIRRYSWINQSHARYPNWATLNVTADSAVTFGYAVRAGVAGGAYPAFPSRRSLGTSSWRWVIATATARTRSSSPRPSRARSTSRTTRSSTKFSCEPAHRSRRLVDT